VIRVQLPAHLRTLARVTGEVALDLPSPVTIAAVIDELERRYPALRGTIRDHGATRRRPLVRFYACEEDLSYGPLDTPLPDDVNEGREPLLVVGAIAGG
jgi:molybdopterin synthase sulfur carrier subunit